jgi:hypothetical protein
MCITCGAPRSVAPDLIELYEDPTGTGYESHCYFKKQPETADELDRAITAMGYSCCGAYRYAGSDPDTIRKLSLARLDDSIDQD